MLNEWAWTEKYCGKWVSAGHTSKVRFYNINYNSYLSIPYTQHTIKLVYLEIKGHMLILEIESTSRPTGSTGLTIRH